MSEWATRKELPRVSDLIAFLQTLPQDAFVCVQGQEYCFTDCYELHGDGRIRYADIRMNLGLPKEWWDIHDPEGRCH